MHRHDAPAAIRDEHRSASVRREPATDAALLERHDVDDQRRAIEPTSRDTNAAPSHTSIVDAGGDGRLQVSGQHLEPQFQPAQPITDRIAIGQHHLGRRIGVHDVHSRVDENDARPCAVERRLESRRPLLALPENAADQRGAAQVRCQPAKPVAFQLTGPASALVAAEADIADHRVVAGECDRHEVEDALRFGEIIVVPAARPQRCVGVFGQHDRLFEGHLAHPLGPAPETNDVLDVVGTGHRREWLGDVDRQIDQRAARRQRDHRHHGIVEIEPSTHRIQRVVPALRLNNRVVNPRDQIDVIAIHFL